MKTFTIPCVLAIVSSLGVSAGDVYVSPEGSDGSPGTRSAPFATIERARNEVRLLRSVSPDEDYTIVLEDGTHRLERTLVFDLADSMPVGHSLTVTAASGAEPVVTSLVPISTWRRLTESPRELPSVAHGKIWVAELPETRDGTWRFRTLYDRGAALPRARSKGFRPRDQCPEPVLSTRWHERSVLQFPAGTVREWENLEDVEILIRPSHQWLVNYLPLASVDEKAGVARTAIEGTYRLSRVKGKDWAETCWVENVLEALDEPGEWVLNTREGRLYYWPASGEPGDGVAAPRLRELIRVEGFNSQSLEGDIPVRGIQFRDLTFSGGDRDVWTAGDRGIQHDWEMFDKDNALLRFRGAEACAVRDCVFEDSGGGGLRVDLRGRRIEVTGSTFRNLGGTGILLCGYGPGLKDVNGDHLVQNNEMHHVGRLLWHSPAIFIWQSGRNRILNNHIHHVPYDGIVLSGVRPRFFGITDPVKWTTAYRIPDDNRENMAVIRQAEIGVPENAAAVMRFAHARDNLVQDNKINNAMEVLGDGNAIYLSCAGSGNVIRRNLVYATTRTEDEIRFDDDQQESVIEENIVFGHGIKLKHRNAILNNIIVGGGVSIRPETEIGAEVRHNITIATENPHRLYRTNVNTVKMEALLALARPDHNIFYSPNESAGREAFAALQGMGHDLHSEFIDPGFVNLEGGDLRLSPESPARSLGIRSIDTERIGRLEDPAFPRLRREGFNFMTVPEKG